ncbi:MAG: (2Fe-2S)-binding protein [Dehalococcoidia bacterium]
MKRLVTATINGEVRDFAVDTRLTLLEALRDELRLTGTKEGCGNGNCGSCTVLINDRPVDSCLVFAAEVEGQEVITVEGLAQDGRLHSIQQAFIDEGGLQCGFCTPGFIMSTKALLEGNPNPTESEIRLAIAGNLCRCTGYDKIVRAIMAAAPRKA